MTKVEIFRKNGNIIGYKASGHSGYSEQGSDIICSAISTSLQMTLIGIQEVLKLKVDFKINDGFLDVDLKNISLDKLTQINILTETMAIFLKELTKQYPKYIRLVEKEDK
ncbi:ribosomal-processing cysteine protease Prp [Fusobacterium pseudoperiodonticum]|uniref:ribosomal-processing cysteine protease Prp n=1 Tax=Fusobacterium pseudoperiodonticum TaxID=2663009 RepID=UPI0028E82791|nr:ribosomal-processing cysteine protease Prp [Fusobacterium pseudoperiodonticum]